MPSPIEKSQDLRQVDAVVLAGGSGAALNPAYRVKGFVPILDRPLVSWVVDALKAAQSVRSVVVVVPTDPQAAGANTDGWVEKADQVVVCDKSFADNLEAGLAVLSQDLMVLGITGDLPALTPAAVDDLVFQTLDAGAGVSYPLIPEEDVLEQFPGSVRTFLKLKGGRATGGNGMVCDPRLFGPLKELCQAFFDTRKSPVAMLKIVGPAFAVKFVTGTLDPKDVERKMEKLMNTTCAALYIHEASIGNDVDKPADFAPIEAVLKERLSCAAS